ncbi:MAG TPA: YicC/YloC family endoribonuclease, partial [Phycisphaerae bacterium]|nr:YicC/YloC family endoribonuclease [Phycisphaerae bacterium]
VRVGVEIRTINNRFLKVTQRLPDGLGAVEVAIERFLRAGISRGTVNVGVTVEPRGPAARVPINTDILAAYAKDLSGFAGEHMLMLADQRVPLDALLALPGVLGSEDVLVTGIAGLQEQIEAAVSEALDQLNRMRDAEGEATAKDMAATLDGIEQRIAAVEQRAPAVVDEYRTRLRERIGAMLEGVEITLDDQSLIREVAFFAERSDINEELARLASHVEQFRERLDDAGPVGRKLEFLTQEMYREVNTIGAKANDPETSREVVEIKVGVDRLREHTQNIE